MLSSQCLHAYSLGEGMTLAYNPTVDNAVGTNVTQKTGKNTYPSRTRVVIYNAYVQLLQERYNPILLYIVPTPWVKLSPRVTMPVIEQPYSLLQSNIHTLNQENNFSRS